MRAGIFQAETAGLSLDRRLDALEAAARQADVELLVCPELYLSGYAIGEEVAQHAQPADGPFAQGVATIAEQTATAIAYGFPESQGGDLYNSVQCISATGQVLGRHRKLVLPPGFEGRIFSTGSGITTFSLHGICFAMLVCYDVEFPETVRAAVEAGAHAVIVPTALEAQWGVVANRVVPTRAFENGVYVLYANHAGTEADSTYFGGSCIVSPTGEDLARARGERALISAELSLAEVDMARGRLPYQSDLRRLRPRLSPEEEANA